ncbi:hypothetical protein CGCF413_v008635 [Colletotrichum fructicola]|nr:hypothetical protein CGCF413_v008635 [Colletotrichum fructicola]
MELEIFSHFCGRQKRALLEEEAGLDFLLAVTGIFFGRVLGCVGIDHHIGMVWFVIVYGVRNRQVWEAIRSGHKPVSCWTASEKHSQRNIMTDVPKKDKS